ncbi:MAG: asparaginase, partial [Gammaproteobacteria bacterium]|nr:asparaginase [Gammaproteobacteria bacterium]
TISSSGITTDDWLALNRLIHDVANASPPPDGIVVTHGTATLEETAYLLHLTLKTAIPVVLVGAQRPSNALGTDAGMNLLNAVRVAASPDARGMGVLTVLNDEIQSARDVTKTSTFRLQTFKSPDAGPLGIADADGRVVFYRRPFRRHAPDTEFDIRTLHALPRVDISYSYAGADGTAIEAFVAKGARAIVSAGVAPGLPTPAQREALRAAHNAGVTVVYSSRAGGGRVMLRDAMQEDGIIAADNLNPQKARVLIMLGLTREDSTPSALQRMFEVY